MTNSINEIEGNEALFVIGSNATEAHPIMGNQMKRAVKNGAKLIVVDPRRTELAKLAHLWLPIKSGTDVALINGLMHIIVKEGWEDKEFIEERCTGYEDILKIIENYPPDFVSKLTEIPEESLYEAAKIYANTRKAGIYYTLGITEHTTGTANVMNLANLAMITGHLGLENSGINHLRGQNNVQGACDMGALPNTFPGYQSVFEEKNLKLFEEYWGVELSRTKGLRIPEMIDEAHDGNLKAMYIMGEDPVLTDPDANHVKKSLENLDFLVVQDIFLSETAKFADVVLPAACYAEKNGTFTNSERRVQRVRKAVEAPGEARADWEILAEVSRRMGGKDFDYNDAEELFEEIRRTTPSYRGITYERIDKVGISWPCPTEEHPGTKFLHKGTFPRGKGLMIPVDYELPAELVCKEYPILLTTGRMLFHYNVMTVNSDKLNEMKPYELAEMNEVDAQKLNVENEGFIKVTSRRGSILTRIRITDRVKPGMMFMTFHYKESPVNELTNAAFDPITKTAEYKISAVRVEKVDEVPELSLS
jgi:formate dehydrogenase alpha subunit